VMQHSKLLVELFNVLYRSTINKKVRFHRKVQFLRCGSPFYAR
jgi:hypothetical protein